MIIDPLTHDNFYSILTGVVVPRPIAFVSSISNSGVRNLAPFSFFNAVCSVPPTVVVSIKRHTKDKLKDTLSNIEDTGDFVINTVVDSISKSMNITSADYPAPVDEFEIAHLTPLNSNIVRAPRVKESPVNLECQMKQIIPIGSGLEQYGLVIGEVVLAHVQDRIISGNAINQSKLTAIGRLAGSMYTHTHEVFSMDRPIYDNV